MSAMNETTTAKGSFGKGVSGSRALLTLPQRMDSLLDTIRWLSLSQSPSTAELLENGRKWRFPMPTSDQTRRKSGSLGGVVIGFVVLETMVEKYKPSLDTIHCLNPLISPSTARAKTVPFPIISVFQDPNEDEAATFWDGCRYDNCASWDEREERIISC